MNKNNTLRRQFYHAGGLKFGGLDIHPAALLRISQIIGTPKTPALLNIGRTHFYRLVKEGKFPKPTKLGHMSVWKASDALQAIAKLTEAK